MIIALTGKKRSGKDTAGSYLVDKYGFTKYAFAQPIKDICKIIFLWDERHIEGELKEVIDTRWGISPREAFQTIGTDIFRDTFPKLHKKFNYLIGMDIWIKRFIYWYQDNKDKDIVITDLRFFNEAQILRELGGYIVKIISPVPNQDKHKSETEMDRITANKLIDNYKYSVEFIHEMIEVYYQCFKHKEYCIGN